MHQKETHLRTVLIGLAPVALGIFVIPFLSAGSETPSVLNFRLVDIAESAQVVGIPSFGRGVAWGDFDQDGNLELFVSDSQGRNRLYSHNGDLSFTDVSATVGLPSVEELTWGAAWIDYDNDGDSDLYLAQGGLDGPAENRLYRNDLNTTGRFTDATAVAGAGGGELPSMGAAWADYDRDGFLDVYIANQNEPNVLLRNRSDGRFEDVSAAAGVDDDGNARFPFWFDYDRDGWMDIFIANRRGAHRLYRNNGNGTFTDVAAQAGVNAIPRNTHVAVAEDFNHDGWFDLYLVSWNSTRSSEPSALYINRGDGTFVNLGGATRTAIASNTMSVQTADLNNDGHVDIIKGNGEPEVPGDNFLLLNAYDQATGRLTFQDLSDESGLTAVPPGRSHGIAAADIDNDGDLDLYISDGGPAPTTDRRAHYRGESAETNHFFLNEGGNSNNWIKLRPKGTISNRDGIGAEIKIVAGDLTQYRMVKGGSGFSSMNSPFLHIGLGPAGKADLIEIRWPSGVVQTLRDVPARTTLTVVEPE